MRAVAFALGIDVFHALFGNQDTFPCASGQHAVGGFGTVGIVGVYRTAVGSGLHEHVEHLVWIFYVGGARGACCIATMKKKRERKLGKFAIIAQNTCSYLGEDVSDAKEGIICTGQWHKKRKYKSNTNMQCKYAIISLPEAGLGTGQPLRVVIKIILISITFICIFILFVDGTQLTARPLVL